MSEGQNTKTSKSEVTRIIRDRIRTIQVELDAIASKYQREIAELEGERNRLSTIVSNVAKTTKRSTSSMSPATITFRANSKMKRAFELLKQTGRPMTVLEILQGIGEPTSKKTAMASDLYRAVKRTGKLKVASPGLFAIQETDTMPTIQLPDTFGKDE